MHARRVTPVDPAHQQSARNFERGDRARRAAERRAKAIREAVRLHRDYRDNPQMTR